MTPDQEKERERRVSLEPKAWKIARGQTLATIISRWIEEGKWQGLYKTIDAIPDNFQPMMDAFEREGLIEIDREFNIGEITEKGAAYAKGSV
jgi:hypothetical protein